jgi:hypothetical protein
MFSSNTTDDRRREVLHTLQIPRETVNERYLGLPVHVGKEKIKVVSYLKERIWQRIQGWKEKLLSCAGKEVLIKAVAQAIPTFAMGCFDITKELCDQISAMIGKYWWSSQDKENKMHWLRWELLLQPKSEGGLGFRDIHTFSLAMLAKQAWRLVKNLDSLCARMLQAKYFKNGTVLNATSSYGMSYTWGNILKGVQVLKNGIIWRVGNGKDINIWTDTWLPREWMRRPVTPRGRNLITRELIDPTTGQWDVELVTQTFFEEDVRSILSIPVHQDLEDVVAWHYDTRGLFSVKSAYKVQRSCERRKDRRGAQSSSNGTDLENEMWKKLWKLECPGKIKHFLWRFAHNSLALPIGLEKRGMELDTKCVMCERQNEDGCHLFFKCKYAMPVWKELGLEHIRGALAALHSSREVIKLILGMKEG